MKLDTYQGAAQDFDLGCAEVHGLPYYGLGIAGEAGEVADQIKKMLRDDDGVLTDERRKALVGELGDTLWFAAMIANQIGVNLSDVATANLDKLASRMERGVMSGNGDNR